MALLLATLQLGCSTDPGISDPIAAIFEGIIVTANKSFVPNGGGQTNVTATVISKNGSPLSDVKVTFETTAGEFSSGTIAATDDAGKATARLQTNNRAIVRARVGSMQSDATMVDVDSPVDLEIDVEGKAYTGQSANVRISAKRKDGHAVTGSVDVDFGDGETSTIEGFTKKTTVGHRYSRVGSYRIRAELTQTAGQQDSATEDVKVEEKVSRQGSPSPSPGPVSGNDELDLNQVSFLHANISGWPATSRVTNVTITGGQICINHTKAGAWPTRTLGGAALEGNPWVVASRDGRWYAATYEWLRPGQICKGITASNIGGHIKRAPLTNWRPRSGEQLGFMVSTLARDANRTSNQRSNVVLVRWP